MGDNKRCGKCRAEKPREDFSRNRRRSDGLNGECRACMKEYRAEYYSRPSSRERQAATNKLYREANPDAIRRRELWTRYRTTPEWFDAKLEDQGGLCSICRRPATARAMHVDHDHRCCAGSRSCGECLRDLLCGRCNPALGAFNDDADLIDAAAAYLRRWSRS